VRDRTLCLIEDFGRGLPLPAYKEAFENLEVRDLWAGRHQRSLPG
jgi:hypothetical protein